MQLVLPPWWRDDVGTRRNGGVGSVLSPRRELCALELESANRRFNLTMGSVAKVEFPLAYKKLHVSF